jgi:hypothetical protein
VHDLKLCLCTAGLHRIWVCTSCQGLCMVMTGCGPEGTQLTLATATNAAAMAGSSSAASTRLTTRASS